MDTLAFFYMTISHSAEYTILFIQFVSIVTSSYHKKKKTKTKNDFWRRGSYQSGQSSYKHVLIMFRNRNKNASPLLNHI